MAYGQNASSCEFLSRKHYISTKYAEWELQIFLLLFFFFNKNTLWSHLLVKMGSFPYLEATF